MHLMKARFQGETACCMQGLLLVDIMNRSFAPFFACAQVLVAKAEFRRDDVKLRMLSRSGFERGDLVYT
jgi:hypothetical protein